MPHSRWQTTRSRVALLLVLVLVASGCGWPALGYGPARTGHNPFEAKLSRDNVANLAPAWSASLPDSPSSSSLVVAHGSVFVAAGTLRAYSANGTTGCAGVPVVCQPLWTAANGGQVTPTVAGNTVFTAVSGTLSAYDARGVTNCSGTPKVCSPLWTASLGADPGSPAVSGGLLYIGSDRLRAFDATGTTGCSGAPKTCSPLWASAGKVGGTPAVVGDRVYVATNLTVDGGAPVGTLTAFDADGSTGCTAGSTPVCAPVWTFERDAFCSSCGLSEPPSVAGGRVYIQFYCCSPGEPFTQLLTFDAAGQLGCMGTPRRCEPTDTAAAGSHPAFPKPPVGVADGLAYVGGLGLTAFDVTDLSRRWTAPTAISHPTIANGVAYVLGARFTSGSSFALAPHAYDARGQTACTGTPTTCEPLWVGPEHPTGTGDLIQSTPAPVVADGVVYVRDRDRLDAYRVPEPQG